MSEESDTLLAAMRKRHDAGEEFARLKERLDDYAELDLRFPSDPELLLIAERLAQLLQTEMELNQRLSALAMGMQEAGAISIKELNVLMGVA